MKIFANMYLQITRELPVDNKIPFIGTEIIKNATELETLVYRKRPIVVCSCIFKTMKANVTKPVY